jgi:hypothetical protein
VPIRNVNTSVPKNFADAIMKCLEKDPWDRWGTTMELWSELQTVSFFPPRTEIKSASPSSSGITAKVAFFLAGMGLIAGFMWGRMMYQDGGVFYSPPSTGAAEAFVAGWLDHPGGDSTAFEPEATVMHLAVDPAAMRVVELSPSDLPRHLLITRRVANVVSNPLEVRGFGDMAIVSGSYRISDSVCGKAWFVLRARGDEWRMVHVRVQDLRVCDPGI